MLPLTPEQREQMVLDNMAFVHHIIKKNFGNTGPNDYNDLVQIGNIGLIKAARTFDPEKEKSFLTYASVCIKNEINMYHRKSNRWNSESFLNDCKVLANGDGKELTLETTLADNYDLENETIEQDYDSDIFARAMTIILNYLSALETMAVLYQISGMYKHKEIAELLGLSRSYITRICKKAFEAIREGIQREEAIDSVYSMTKVGKLYRFSCKSEKVNEKLENFLKESNSPSVLNWMVAGEYEQIEVLMDADAMTFKFIADFMKKINGYE